MVWVLTNGTTSYSCLGNSIIRNKLNELDTAEVQCVGTFTPDTVVYILDGATTIFRGYIKESIQEANGKLYKLSLVESAVDLKYKIVEYSGSRSFIRTGLNVGQLVDLILTSSGWVKGTADSTAVASLGFYNATASASLYKLIKEIQGKYLWFTDNGTSKQVWWGLYRTDRTGSPITTWISKQAETDSIDRNVTKITVYGENSTIYGSAGSGTKEVLYSYPPARTASECTAVATKLLADIGANKSRFTLTLAKTNTYYAGDKVRVSSVDYVVHDVTRTMSNTVLGIGAGEVSYAETLGANLTLIDGSIKTPTQKSYDGGEQSANATDTWKQNINVKDVNNISDFNLKVRCKTFKKTTTVAASTEYLSDVTPILGAVTSNPNENLTAYGGSNYYPYNTSSGYRYITKSGLTNGFQNALFTFNCNLQYNYTSTAQYVLITPQYSFNGSTWYTLDGDGITYQIRVELPRQVLKDSGSTQQVITDVIVDQFVSGDVYIGTDHLLVGANDYVTGAYDVGSVVTDTYATHTHIPINTNQAITIPVAFTVMVPGSSTSSTIYVRAFIYNPSDATVTILSAMGMLQVVQRHVHSVTSTYDKAAETYGVTSFTVKVGGVTVGTQASPTVDTDYTFAITSYLATGDNAVEIIPNAKCNVNVTGSYYSV